jgi:hypothetical protein
MFFSFSMKKAEVESPLPLGEGWVREHSTLYVVRCPHPNLLPKGEGSGYAAFPPYTTVPMKRETY